MAFVGELAAPLPGSMRARLDAFLCRTLGCAVLAASAAGAACLLTWSNADPSFTHAASGPARNILGPIGAIVADLVMQLFGLAGPLVILPPLFWGMQLVSTARLEGARTKIAAAPLALVLLASAMALLPKFGTWPLTYNLGGFLGDHGLRLLAYPLRAFNPQTGTTAASLLCLAGGILLLMRSLGLSRQDLKRICPRPRPMGLGKLVARWWRQLGDAADRHMPLRREPTLHLPPGEAFHHMEPEFPQQEPVHPPVTAAPPARGWRTLTPGRRSASEDHESREARKIAKRFAPDGDRAGLEELNAGVLPDAPGLREPHFSRDQVEPDPDWRQPEPQVPPSAGWRVHRPGSEELYGRAVAIVLADRKATNEYLQKRLTIGYMAAADLIERMEQEGILGAPVYNGMRPILV
jgi:hypothetical protein